METKKISKRCPLHIEKWKDVYCHTCEQAICLRCMFENHRHHDCTELDMAARRKREILRRLARAIVELLSKLNGRRDDLIDVKSRACNLAG
ncbi:hypothetical protein NP493_1048g00015 [Ridgeia piscesae]|uniref:B box-type domain-containing protein n=1 Tax=Ridgeia piscesae TaxID=27915 RepID=A0AAD9KIA5_RIDPI|nr:hypothetical protein NP493_1048g00015 [Ridgeia piscesae]